MVKMLKEGFGLLNRNLKIFLAAVLMSGIFEVLINQRISNAQINILLSIAKSVFFVVYFGFYFAIFKFFALIQQNKELSIKLLISEVTKNSKRLIFPLIISAIIGGLSLVVIFIILLVLGFKPQSTTYTGLLIFLFCMAALLAVMPIFFSVEEKGFLASLKGSMFFMLKNPRLISVMVLYNLLALSITKYFSHQFLLQSLLNVFVLNYLLLGIDAAALLYYQSKQRSQPL